MDMTPQEYQEYVKRLAPKSPMNSYRKSGSFFNVSSLVKFAPRMAQRDFLKKVALPLF